MADNAAEGTPRKLPPRIARIVDRLAAAGRSAGVDRPLLFWDIGEKISRLRANGGDITVAKLFQHTGLSERQMRYCVEVRKAFTRDRLEDLLKQGLGWSTIRELASEGLEDAKDDLIEKFTSGCYSNTELRRKALEKRSGSAGDAKAADEDRNDAVPGAEDRNDAVFQAAARVTKESIRLKDTLRGAANAFEDATAATAPGALLSPETIASLCEMSKALQELLVDAGGLLRHSGALSGE